MTSPTPTPPTLTLNVLSLNCWGLRFISHHRFARLSEISRRIASASPSYDIVCLQEFWVYSDYLHLRSVTLGVLPYGKFYHSGVLGGGLVILSRYRIVESNMWQYVLNGRPTAFWRGDWYVGKGVAGAVLEIEDAGVGGGMRKGKRRAEVFCTHLHAPYEKGEDSYLCHRTAQAWQLSKLLRASVQRGHIPIALGDFNMLPNSLAHHIITTHGLVSDAWLSAHPQTPAITVTPVHASYNLTTLGATCDSILNTWRLAPTQLDLPSSESPDPDAQRLDYIFHSPLVSRVREIKVGFTELYKLPGKPKPGKGITRGGMVSLSDHFSVEVKLEITPLGDSVGPLISFDAVEVEEATQEGSEDVYLSMDVIEEIQALTMKYARREEWEFKWRIWHFWASTLVLVALHVAVWWSTYDGVAFLCVVLSWMVGVSGVVNGLIGFLFMGSELNALREFDEEIRIYKEIAQEKFAKGKGRPRVQELGAVEFGLSEQRIRREEEIERAAVDRHRGVVQ
ncbi:Endonuclease/exonuclease/phosphatase [Tirmania nivea]|nr:Endonuclease/exonuclease/phosphatase [Tirmania nivea]